MTKSLLILLKIASKLISKMNQITTIFQMYLTPKIKKSITFDLLTNLAYFRAAKMKLLVFGANVYLNKMLKNHSYY